MARQTGPLSEGGRLLITDPVLARKAPKDASGNCGGPWYLQRMAWHSLAQGRWC